MERCRLLSSLHNFSIERTCTLHSLIFHQRNTANLEILLKQWVFMYPSCDFPDTKNIGIFATKWQFLLETVSVKSLSHMKQLQIIEISPGGI